MEIRLIRTILIPLVLFGLASAGHAQAPVDFCAAVTEIPHQECTALVTFFDNTDGPNWVSHAGWLETNTPCSWAGIACEEGHVTGLQLPQNHLHGKTTALVALTDIPYLQDLDLKSMPCGYHLPCYANTFSGNIPPEFGSLSHLQSIDLFMVGLSGPIPPALGELSQLQRLNLAANNLTGPIPAELANLSQLTVLNIGGNKLTGSIPPALGRLSQLKSLTLGSACIPVPYFPGRYCWGENSFAGGIPEELGNLTNLETLDISRSQLTGKIPAALGNLINLQYLSLFDNQLDGVMPKQLGNMANLYRVELENNRLSGSIPPEIATMTALRWLDLSNNDLSGQIPAALGELTALRWLDLSNNALSGQIPVKLGELPDLYWLSLNQNRLSGSIPVELGNINSLRWLLLQNNQLSGSIPPELGQNILFEKLSLEYNQLEGVAPDSICNVTDSGLRVSYNKLWDGPPCLDDKDPNWRATQTVPPTDLSLVPNYGAVTLRWSPILYSSGAGNYRIEYSSDGGSTWRLHGTTADKRARGYVAAGLLPGVEYSFRIQTFSAADGYVWESVYSEVVTGSPTGESIRQFLPLHFH